MRRAVAALLMAALGACDIVDPPPAPTPTPTPRPLPVRPVEPEIPVDERGAAALSREFALPGCRDVTRLREVRANGLRVESWRIRSGDACFKAWADRAERYSLLPRIVKNETRQELDRLPWLCGDGGNHVLQCSTQGREPTLAIEQPNFAEFLLFRRISKDKR